MLGLTVWGAMMRHVCLSGRPLAQSACVIAALLPLAFSDRVSADEAGVSFWLQGQFGSFAAAPSNPGWSFESTFYHATAEAGAGISFARGGGIQAGMKSPTDFVMVTPTYVFATPVLGGQAAIGMTGLFGRNTTSVSATLSAPGGESLSGSRSDTVLGFGDLYPAATLKWNRDVHNVMVYATAAVPVGVYDPTRLATMGLGHWAADAGAGYTYLNEKAGFEWTAVFGFTFNFINPYTQYRSGIDAHLDWAISPYLTEKMHIGAVGYVYNQITDDSGASPALGGFRSRVAGIGPQVGFFFPFADREGYVNLRGYYEFNAKNRLEGWTAYVTFSVEAPEQKSAQPKALRVSTLPR